MKYLLPAFSILLMGFIASHFMGKPLHQFENIDRMIDDSIPGAILRKSLGGLQVLVANFFWIQRESHWEKREWNPTMIAMEMAIQINPRNVHFWIHGARSIAFDMPDWRLKSLYDKRGPLPESIIEKIKKEQVEEALRLLDQAAILFPDNYRIPLEQAQVCMQSLMDEERAVHYYKKVTELPNCPNIVHRVYAETLFRLGNTEGALGYYMEHHNSLNPDDPTALKSSVYNRILELQKILKFHGQE